MTDESKRPESWNPRIEVTSHGNGKTTLIIDGTDYSGAVGSVDVSFEGGADRPTFLVEFWTDDWTIERTN